VRSLQITGPGSHRIAEVRRPRCGPDEVLIEVKACTICNQHDLAVLAGERRDGSAGYPLEPGFPGHEGAGVVVEAGAEVTGLVAGDRVAMSGIGGPPLYSQYVTRRPEAVARFSPRVDFPVAAPMELFGCVNRAFTHASDVAGRRVGVVGLGPAGQAATALARAYGAKEIVGFDLDADRREKSREMGATQVVDGARFLGAAAALKRSLQAPDAPSADEQAVLEDARAAACPLLFECSGHPRSLESSFLLAGKELVIFGFTAEPVEAVPAVWFAKELVIRSSRILTSDDLRTVTAFLEEGRIDPRPIITDVMPFAEYGDALERIRSGRALKIALVWE
jgi:threonine dehydrogenase-like Zn-dependent dehydrogenase